MNEILHSRFLSTRHIWMLRSVSKSMKEMVRTNWMTPRFVIGEQGFNGVTSSFLYQFRGKITVECLYPLSSRWLTTLVSVWTDAFPLVQLKLMVTSCNDLILLAEKINDKKLEYLHLVYSSRNADWRRSLDALAALRNVTKWLELKLEMDGPGPDDGLWEFAWRAGCIVSLRKLECRWCGSIVANQIAELTDLRELKLNGLNPLVNIDGEESFSALLASLSALNALTSLDLSSNRFGEIFSDESRLTFLMPLGAAFSALTALTSLNLSDNGDFFEGSPWMDVCTAVSALTALTSLDCSECFMDSDCAMALGASLSSLVRLTELDCRRNNFHGEAWRAVMDGLECATELKTLNGYTNMAALRAGIVQEVQLSGNELTVAVAPLLPRSASTLARLDLSTSTSNYEYVNAEENATLCKALRQLTLLTSLDLSGLEVPHDGGVSALARALARMASLATLNLSNWRTNDGGALALARGFARLTSLTTLDLSCSAADAAGALELVQPLMRLTTLTSLSLSCNNIDAASASALAHVLNRLTAMQALRLSANKICAAGASALALALTRLTGLHTLDLGGNMIASEGASALALALTGLTGLKALDLSTNAIGLAGVSALAPVLAALTSLSALDLGDNGELGDSCATALVPALTGLRGLTSLCLSENWIRAGGVAALEALRVGLPCMTSLEHRFVNLKFLFTVFQKPPPFSPCTHARLCMESWLPPTLIVSFL